MTIFENYERLQKHYQNLHAEASKTGNIIAALRLFSIFLLIYSSYHFYKTEQTAWLFGAGILLFSLFLWLVSLHLKYKERSRLYTSLSLINENEMA